MVLDRQKKKIILGIIAILVVLIIIQLFYVFNSPQVVEERIFEVKAEIGKSPGVLIDAKKVNFGRVTTQGTALKEIMINNTHEEEVTVVVRTYGEIAEMVEVRPNHITLLPEEEVTLKAQFSAGNNPKGNYSGYLTVLLMS